MVDNMEYIEKTGALKNLTDEDRKMQKKYGKRLGGALCSVLRHNPDKINVKMNKQAWVNVNELIEKFNKNNERKPYYLSLPVLLELVRTDNKQRYGLKGEGDDLMIRCRQGHSIPWLEMDYREMIPPDVLYHGTIDTVYDSIMEKGILPMKRQKVHMSKDIKTAKTVGGRRKSEGKTIIFKIDTAQMALDGIIFYLSDNDVWLTDYVDPKYVSLLKQEEDYVF
jgi:putative RNA 2'-phosphotransferase